MYHCLDDILMCDLDMQVVHIVTLKNSDRRVGHVVQHRRRAFHHETHIRPHSDVQFSSQPQQGNINQISCTPQYWQYFITDGEVAAAAPRTCSDAQLW